jgi:hypothetical protein
MAELLAVANHSPREDAIDDEGHDDEEHAKDDHAATLTDAASRRGLGIQVNARRSARRRRPSLGLAARLAQAAAQAFKEGARACGRQRVAVRGAGNNISLQIRGHKQPEPSKTSKHEAARLACRAIAFWVVSGPK